MAQQNIVSFILSQRKQGKQLEEINRFLLEAGYEKSEVASSVQYVMNLQANPRLAEEQRIQQLSGYIQKQLNAGYDVNTISNFLTSRGYPYYEVTSAVQQLQQPKKEAKIEHKLLVFALIAMFLMTTAVTVMYFKAYTKIGIGVPEKLLDVEAEKLTTIVQQGGELVFQTKLINFGYEKRFDVLLTYKVIDRDTQGAVLEKSETVALSTTLENIVKFNIPEDIKPGNYVLRVDAQYKEFTATSGFIFDILPKEMAAEKIEEIRKQLPTAENITKIPELGSEAPTQEPTPETKPVPIPAPEEKLFYEGKTRQQAFEEVKAVSVRDPTRAISMCNEFRLSANKQACITMLAEFKKTPAVCEEITDLGQRDNCYVQIAMATGIASACAQVQDARVKQSCEMVLFTKKVPQITPQTDKETIYKEMAPFGLQTTPTT
jgi:hypothetical protein